MEKSILKQNFKQKKKTISMWMLKENVWRENKVILGTEQLGFTELGVNCTQSLHLEVARLEEHACQHGQAGTDSASARHSSLSGEVPAQFSWY